MKIRPIGAELFHAEDRRTDMTKLIAAFHNFANAPNISRWLGKDFNIITISGVWYENTQLCAKKQTGPSR